MRNPKLVREALEDFLRPKTKEDIKGELRELEPTSMLTYGAKFGFLDVVKDALELDPRILETYKRDALEWSARRGHLDIVRYFLEERGYEPHKHNNFLLTISSDKGHLDVVRYLIEHVDYGRDALSTALGWAILSGHLDVVRYLVEEAKADPDDHDGRALKSAISHERADIVKYLVDEAGADLNNIYTDPDPHLKNILKQNPGMRKYAPKRSRG